MADILLDVQAQPNTPASGQSVLFCDTTSKKWQSKNDAGLVDTLGDIEAFSTVNQTGFAADVALAGSVIAIPSSLVRAGSMYRLLFDMTKTAAGTATFTITIRFGTAGAIGDAARLTFTFAAGTAAIDSGMFEVLVHFRNVGAAAVAVGIARCFHHLAATGLISTGASGFGQILVTSASFDTTVPASFISASVNGGASFSGTGTLVQAQLLNV